MKKKLIYLSVAGLALMTACENPTVPVAPDLVTEVYVGYVGPKEAALELTFDSSATKKPTKLFYADYDATTDLPGTSLGYAEVTDKVVSFDLSYIRNGLVMKRLVPDAVMQSAGQVGTLQARLADWLGSYGDNVSSDAQTYQIQLASRASTKGHIVFFESRTQYKFSAGGYEVDVKSPGGVGFVAIDESTYPKKVYSADPAQFVVTDRL